MDYLCDTNILSELTRPLPNSGVLAWASQVKVVALSAIVVEELAFGLAWRPNPRVRAWFDDFIAAHCQVLPVTDAVARRAGTLRGSLRTAGQTRTQADMLIAATAVEYGLTLVTRRTRDFEGCGVALLCPFSVT